MKSKTKKMRRVRNSPLHDAVSIKCSEKGFSLLQWDFSSKSGFPKYSHQLPTDVVEYILQKVNIDNFMYEMEHPK